MAFGLTPKHTEEIYLADLTPEQILALSIETVKQLNWQINYVSETGIMAHTNKGLFSWNADIKILTQYGNTLFVTSESSGNEMIDWGKNKKMAQQFIETFEIAKLSFTPEELSLKHKESAIEQVPVEEDLLQIPPQTAKEQIRDFFLMFVPKKDLFVTPILIDLNIIIFIIMLVSGVHLMNPTSEALLKWGANFKPYTLNDEPWRLITNTFVHIGIIHLLMNMFALLYIGVLLEGILGKARFAASYLLTGLIASITSLCWHDLSVSAGASGAIFGMYGVFIALLTTNIIEKNTRKALLPSISLFVVYNLIYGLKDNIDNAAHIGGLFSGMLIGYAFVPSIKRGNQTVIKNLSIGIIAFVTVAISTVIYLMMPNNAITNQQIMTGTEMQNGPAIDDSRFHIESEKDRNEYQEAMTDFISIESMARNIFPLDTTLAGKEKSLSQIKDTGIYYWNRNLEILASLDKLELPTAIVERNKLLKEYCLLFIDAYKLTYKAIDERSKKYDSSINDLDLKIEAKMRELKKYIPQQ